MFTRFIRARDKLLPLIINYRTTLLDLLGGILITTGIMLISIPVGFIFAGLVCFVISSRLPEKGEIEDGKSVEKPF